MRAFRTSLWLAATLATALPDVARSWSLKTHVWIAQEVLHDVLPDGMVTIAGKEFSVPSHVVNALRARTEKG
jgi:hypothetical protein